MNFQQAISQLGKYHPQMSLLSEQCQETSDVMRIFDLKAGEGLTLKVFGDYDYLYALKGHASLRGNDGVERTLQAGSKEQQRFMIPPETDTLHIEATDRVLLYQIAGKELDYLVALGEVVDLLEPDDEEAQKRARLVRNSKPFHRLPIETVAEALGRLQRIAVTKDQEIVRQGEPGDAFYVIEEGEAEVWELGLYDDEPQLVNELAAGDGFGEEALVMGGSRGATVRMTPDGHLLVLNKTDFDQLVKKRMVEWVDSGTAKSLLDGGYQLLDVRYEEEFEESYIPGSILIPLQQLRKRYTELDPEKSYVAYCKGGMRSAVASLLLTQRGYEAVSLTGGISEWPHEVVKNY
jgi:rhodanese-related sulfurtransferase